MRDVWERLGKEMLEAKSGGTLKIDGLRLLEAAERELSRRRRQCEEEHYREELRRVAIAMRRLAFDIGIRGSRPDAEVAKYRDVRVHFEELYWDGGGI